MNETRPTFGSKKLTPVLGSELGALIRIRLRQPKNVTPKMGSHFQLKKPKNQHKPKHFLRRKFISSGSIGRCCKHPTGKSRCSQGGFKVPGVGLGHGPGKGTCKRHGKELGRGRGKGRVKEGLAKGLVRGPAEGLAQGPCRKPGKRAWQKWLTNGRGKTLAVWVKWLS